MQRLQPADHFIGRSYELELFMRWLTEPDAPWILYMHDAVEEANKKGGIGKTWLLRRWAERVRQERQDAAVVMIDFFNVADRDRVTIAEHVIAGLQTLYPAWSPTAFNNTIERYRTQEYRTDAASENLDLTDARLEEELSSALADDMQQLASYAAQERKVLLVIFDTFEVVEQNPGIAVLHPTRMFPDNYQFPGMRVAIAGRNKLDWDQANWIGREQEVQVLALSPFSQQEMLTYIENESVYEIAPQSKDARALYKRTEGRPIIIGLVIDVLNHRILTLADLLAISESEFESHLTPQVNKIENPLNWVILFMAHVYHRFNVQLLEWILRNTQLEELIQEIRQQELVAMLSELSFVRRSSSGDFTLHDEMRRLVTKYCWQVQDPDGSIRKEVSRAVIHYYEQEATQTISEQARQAIAIEILHHRLFIDTDDGLNYFNEQFQGALRFIKTTFARLLLQETQQFADAITLAQRNGILLAEARLLRNEEKPADALKVLQRLRQEADPQWYVEYQLDVLQEEGRCYLLQSKLLEAADSYTQCLNLEQVQADERQRANLLDSLGRVYRRRGQFAIALEYYEQSIALYKKLGHRREYANTLTNISIIYRLQGKIEEALRRCKIAWRIRVELFQEGKISEVQVGFSLHTLGVTYLSVGNIIEAEQHFNDAFDIFLRGNYKAGIAIIYNRFGQIQLLKGELEHAQKWFVTAMEASREIEIEQYINSLNKQGRIWALRQQWTEAATFFEQAIASAQRVPDYYQQTESLIDLADALERMNQEERAQQLLHDADIIAERENYVSLRGLIERARGETKYKAKNYIQAFQHFALYCHHMADYNAIESSAALQRVVNALLGIPKREVSGIIYTLTTYWQMQQLDQKYPEFLQALGEVDNLMLP